MAEIKEQFIQVKTKSNFESELKAGNIQNTSIAFIEDTDQIWTMGKYYSAIPKEGREKQVLTWKSDGEAKWEDISSTFTGMEELLAYGVQFDTEVADPHLTRIGNLSLHKSLPIQSQLKGCIAQGSNIMYWLGESDWRFRKEAISEEVTLNVSDDTYTLTADIFSTLQYNKQWIKIDDVPCQISSIDTTTNTAALIANDDLIALSLESGTKTVELGSVLNGYDGTVRVYCPSFYIKSETEGTTCKVWISTVKINDSYTFQPEILLDAYRSTVLNTVPTNMGYLSTLPVNSVISVVNTETYCRGGGNRSAQDTHLSTNIFRTDLGKPRTYISRSIMRTYAKNTNSALLSYSQYKNIFYWLWVIEYANFNSQEAYNATLTDDGYRQGGMGSGVITWNQNDWTGFNVQYPITPCGYCNEFGNGTNVKDLLIPSFEYNLNTIAVSSMTVNSAITTSTGSNNSRIIKNITSISNYGLYASQTQVWGSVTYVISGLTNGQSIIFKEGSSYSSATTKLTVTSDGTYTVAWSDYNKNGNKNIGFGSIQSECNITIYSSNSNSQLITVADKTFSVPRWRGFDNPFGDIYTNLDGIIIDADADNHLNNMNYIYTCDDPDKFSDSITSDYVKSGENIHQDGYIKNFDLGDSGNIFPIKVGGNTTNYICDYQWTGSKDSVKRTLLVGGRAFNGSFAGLGFFHSNAGVSGAWTTVGFQSVSFVSAALSFN